METKVFQPESRSIKPQCLLLSFEEFKNSEEFKNFTFLQDEINPKIKYIHFQFMKHQILFPIEIKMTDYRILSLLTSDGLLHGTQHYKIFGAFDGKLTFENGKLIKVNNPPLQNSINSNLLLGKEEKEDIQNFYKTNGLIGCSSIVLNGHSTCEHYRLCKNKFKLFLHSDFMKGLPRELKREIHKFLFH
jgi:hypothetical protein